MAQIRAPSATRRNLENTESSPLDILQRVVAPRDLTRSSRETPSGRYSIYRPERLLDTQMGYHDCAGSTSSTAHHVVFMEMVVDMKLEARLDHTAVFACMVMEQATCKLDTIPTLAAFIADSDV